MENPSGESTSPTLLWQLANPEHQDAAWRTFLERYRPLILGWCHRAGLNRTTAEDVCDTVLFRLVRVMRDFVYDPAHRFRGWLKTVVDNEIRTYWRSRSRRPGDLGRGGPTGHQRLEQVPAPDEIDSLVEALDETLEHDLDEAHQIVDRVKKRVQPSTWQAFCLTSFEKVPAQEVARELKLTVAAVYMAKRRVSRMLRAEGRKLQNGTETPEEDES
jgi:RNA polymerase sigma-70 factor (ECF subfamily)